MRVQPCYVFADFLSSLGACERLVEKQRAWGKLPVKYAEPYHSLASTLAPSSISYCSEIVATKQTFRDIDHITALRMACGAGRIRHAIAIFYKYTSSRTMAKGLNVCTPWQTVMDVGYINRQYLSPF
jgi:hypothetical protein